MPGYFPLSIPPSPPSINIISEISFTIISLSSTDKLFMEFFFIREIYYGWYLRYFHSNGASFIFIFLLRESAKLFIESFHLYLRSHLLSSWFTGLTGATHQSHFHYIYYLNIYLSFKRDLSYICEGLFGICFLDSVLVSNLFWNLFFFTSR